MKQAQADADELIAAYRREQQDAFNKNVANKGEFPIIICEGQFILYLIPTSNHQINYDHRWFWWSFFG